MAPTSFILALSALAAAPLWQALAAAQAPAIARGHDLAARRCGSCHAVEATGDSPNPASPPFRTLGRKYPVESLDEALAEGIVVGHAGMPDDPWEADDIRAFITYLESIAEPVPANPAQPNHPGSER